MVLLWRVWCLRDDPEWYLAESLTTGQKGCIPYNFVAMSTVETESYVITPVSRVVVPSQCGSRCALLLQVVLQEHLEERSHETPPGSREHAGLLPDPGE